MQIAYPYTIYEVSAPAAPPMLEPSTVVKGILILVTSE